MLIYQRVIDDWNQIHLIEILLANLLAFQNLKHVNLEHFPSESFIYGAWAVKSLQRAGHSPLSDPFLLLL